MFRSSIQKSEWRVEVTDAERRAALRRYVSKNKVIPQHFESADKFGGADSAGVKLLLQAIEEGDYESKHFANPATPDLLLYMIEREIITYWQGMSAYMYTMTLAQFSDKQRLAPGDGEVKLLREMEFLDLVDEASGDLTLLGKDYCSYLAENFTSFGLLLEEEILKQAVRQLSRFDQKVISVKNDFVMPQAQGRSAYEIYHLISGVVFFTIGKPNRQLIPSLALMNTVMQLMPGNTIQILPVIGAVSEATRNKLHAKDQHPVAVYSPSVKSNIKNVHGRRSGPVPAYLHDIGHVIWGSLLSPAEREVLQKHIIPALEKIKLACDEEQANKLTALINDLSDYDLTPMMNYKNPDNRFEFYINKQMTKNKINEDTVLLRDKILPALHNVKQHVARFNHLSSTLATLNNVTEDAKKTIKSNKLIDRLRRDHGGRPYSHSF